MKTESKAKMISSRDQNRRIYDLLEASGLSLSDDLTRNPRTGKVDLKLFSVTRDGVYIVRETFFYRMGETPEILRQKVVAALAPHFAMIILSAEEHWRAWPKESYWEVRFKVEPMSNGENDRA